MFKLLTNIVIYINNSNSFYFYVIVECCRVIFGDWIPFSVFSWFFYRVDVNVFYFTWSCLFFIVAKFVISLLIQFKGKFYISFDDENAKFYRIFCNLFLSFTIDMLSLCFGIDLFSGVLGVFIKVLFVFYPLFIFKFVTLVREVIFPCFLVAVRKYNLVRIYIIFYIIIRILNTCFFLFFMVYNFIFLVDFTYFIIKSLIVSFFKFFNVILLICLFFFIVILIYILFWVFLLFLMIRRNFNFIVAIYFFILFFYLGVLIFNFYSYSECDLFFSRDFFSYLLLLLKDMFLEFLICLVKIFIYYNFCFLIWGVFLSFEFLFKGLYVYFRRLRDFYFKYIHESYGVFYSIKVFFFVIGSFCFSFLKLLYYIFFNKGVVILLKVLGSVIITYFLSVIGFFIPTVGLGLFVYLFFKYYIYDLYYYLFISSCALFVIFSMFGVVCFFLSIIIVILKWVWEVLLRKLFIRYLIYVKWLESEEEYYSKGIFIKGPVLERKVYQDLEFRCVVRLFVFFFFLFLCIQSFCFYVLKFNFFLWLCYYLLDVSSSGFIFGSNSKVVIEGGGSGSIFSSFDSINFWYLLIFQFYFGVFSCFIFLVLRGVLSFGLFNNIGEFEVGFKDAIDSRRALSPVECKQIGDVEVFKSLEKVNLNYGSFRGMDQWDTLLMDFLCFVVSFGVFVGFIIIIPAIIVCIWMVNSVYLFDLFYTNIFLLVGLEGFNYRAPYYIEIFTLLFWIMNFFLFWFFYFILPKEIFKNMLFICRKIKGFLLRIRLGDFWLYFFFFMFFFLFLFYLGYVAGGGVTAFFLISISFIHIVIFRFLK